MIAPPWGENLTVMYTSLICKQYINRCTVYLWYYTFMERVIKEKNSKKNLKGESDEEKVAKHLYRRK